MHECPNCKQRSISLWRKQFLGPLRKIGCPNCGAQVSVDWLHSIIISVGAWLLPILSLVVFAKASLIYAIVFFVVGMVAIGIYQHFMVRLKVRSVPQPD
jgi:hypothetical protein